MNLEEELLKEHSRRQAEFIAGWVGTRPERIRALMKVFLQGDPLLTQRSAWVVGILGDTSPRLLQPYWGKLLRRIQEPGIHDAARRNVVRALQFVSIPPHLLGTVTTVCFDALSDRHTPIAVRVCAMSVLARIAENKPELGRELRIIIEQHLPYEGPAFSARARRVLRRLR